MTAIQDKGKNIEELTHLQGALLILQILLSETNTLQTRRMNKTVHSKPKIFYLLIKLKFQTYADFRTVLSSSRTFIRLTG